MAHNNLNNLVEMDKKKWIKFKTELGHIGGYRYDKDISEYRIKLFSSVPKTHYYSALNDIGEHFEQNIEPQLKANANA